MCFPVSSAASHHFVWPQLCFLSLSSLSPPSLSQSRFGIPVERTGAHWQRLQESHVPAVHRRLVQPTVPPACVAGLSRADRTSGGRRSHCGPLEELCVQELLHASPRSLLWEEHRGYDITHCIQFAVETLRHAEVMLSPLLPGNSGSWR